MRRIEFLIVGAQKAATTALYEYLGRHPSIFLPSVKEIPFFARDEQYACGPEYLRTFYRDAKAGQVVGGAYVHLMYFPKTVERIARYNPEMRILAVLRNPVDRAYSAYWFARRNGWESERTFEGALAREPERQRGTFHERAELTYLTHGHYAEQLDRFIDTFGRDRVMTVFSESLSSAPTDSVMRVLDWLGVDSEFDVVAQSERVHEAGMPRFAGLHHFLLRDRSPTKAFIRRVVPASVRYSIRRHVVLPFLKANIRPGKYPPMASETRMRLTNYFRPHNARLRALIAESPPSNWE